MNYKKITLDTERKSFESIVAMQGDNKSRYIKATIVNKSIPLDLTGCAVKFSAIKPDMTDIFNDAVITNATLGEVEIELTNQTLAVPGVIQATLVILKEDMQLSVLPFFITVIENPYNSNAIESKSEYKALNNALTTAEGYAKELQDASVNLEEKYTTRLNNFGEQLDNKTNIKTTENIINQNYSKLFDKIKSVNMYVPYNTDEFGDYQTLINKAVEVGCNYISFCPRLAMAEKTSTTITRTTDDTLLQTYIDYAISKGLKIILKPHIFITNGNLGGSSNIQPSDVSLWIQSLQENLVYYYTLLGNKISIMCISNECTNQNDKNYSDWVNLVSTLKSLNSNILTTVATTDIGMITNVVYQIVDIIGCNLYIGLRGDKNTSSYELKKSVYNDYTYSKDFISILLNYSKQYNKPILITEVGCLPFAESLNTPARWSYDSGTTIDEDIQDIYYKTILPIYLESQAFLGCSIWSISDGYTFIGRKAERTLKEMYGGTKNV